MPSLIERDRIIRESWADCRFKLPDAHPSGKHYAVQVMGVVDDPRYRLNGEQPFVDVVAYWPALGKWTVTHSCRADASAHDVEVRVTSWQHMLPLPW